MEKLTEKISSYNIFNNLLPGTLFGLSLEIFTNFSLLKYNVAIVIFLYYFLGLTLSRVGSLVIEPILKMTKFIDYANYRDFIKVSINYPKLETLLEVSNMYRTIATNFLVIMILVLWRELYNPLAWINSLSILLLVLLVLIYLFSYQKQVKYIKNIVLNLQGDANDK